MKVKIFGKGPGLTNRIKKQNSCDYAVLNCAIRLVDGIIDYHFMNDFAALKNTGAMDLIKTKNLIIPSFPHTLISKGLVNINYDYKKFIGFLPKKYDARIHIYDLPTAPIKKFQFLNVTTSVAETAVLWLINKGYTDFEFYGIGNTPGYSKLIYWQKIDKTEDKQWLKKNKDVIIKHLNDNNCNFIFN